MHYLLAAVLAMGVPGTTSPTDRGLTGDYVEARTAEVFTGGCIMGSEGEVSGREALMAWRVRTGSLDGVAPSSIRTMLLVDARATEAQHRALVHLAKSLAPDIVRDVPAAKAAPIEFVLSGNTVRVSADAARLDIQTGVEHTPTCSALKWFEPLARTEGAQIGLTRSFEWTGGGLGPQWKQYDRRSSYVGSFSVAR